MTSFGSISGLEIFPESTAPHKESSKWLRMMYLSFSQCDELYFRSVALVRFAELPFFLFLFDARWARSPWWPPLAALLRRPRLLAMLVMKPTYGSVYTQDSGVRRSGELQKARVQVAGPVYEQEVPSDLRYLK